VVGVDDAATLDHCNRVKAFAMNTPSEPSSASAPSRGGWFPLFAQIIGLATAMGIGLAAGLFLASDYSAEREREQQDRVEHERKLAAAYTRAEALVDAAQQATRKAERASELAAKYAQQTAQDRVVLDRRFFDAWLRAQFPENVPLLDPALHPKQFSEGVERAMMILEPTPRPALGDPSREFPEADDLPIDQDLE